MANSFITGSWSSQSFGQDVSASSDVLGSTATARSHEGLVSNPVPSAENASQFTTSFGTQKAEDSRPVTNFTFTGIEASQFQDSQAPVDTSVGASKGRSHDGLQGFANFMGGQGLASSSSSPDLSRGPCQPAPTSLPSSPNQAAPP